MIKDDWLSFKGLLSSEGWEEEEFDAVQDILFVRRVLIVTLRVIF